METTHATCDLQSLTHELASIEDWYQLGHHLGVTKQVLDRIKSEHGSSISRCKVETLGEWMKRREDKPCWEDVAGALDIMGESELAQKLKELDFVESSVVEPSPNHKSMEKHSRSVESPQCIVIPVDKCTMDVFRQLESKFAALIKDIKNTIDEKKVPILDIYRYIIELLNLQLTRVSEPSTIDQLFIMLRPHYSFLQYSLIKNLVEEFLQDSRPMQASLTAYESELEKFKKGTKMKELVDKIGESFKEEENVAVVMLKLEGEWMDVTMQRFQKLVEVIFREWSHCISRMIKVEKGCMCITWVVSRDVLPFLKQTCASESRLELELMECVGIKRLIIDDVVIRDNSIDYQNKSLLHYSIFKGNVEAVGLLVSAGLDLDYSGNLQDSSRIISSLAAMLVFQTDIRERGVIHRILESLLKLDEGANANASNDSGVTSLMYAATEEDEVLMHLLMRHGAELDQRDGCGQTALIYACANEQLSAVKILLQAKANVNIQCNDGMTALMHAVSNGTLEIVHILLDAGADPNIVSHDGWSALHQACSSSVAPPMLQLLLQFEGDPNLTSSTTPLLHTVLTTYDIHFPPDLLDLQEKIQRLVDAGAEIDVQNNTGTTALMLATRQGLINIVSLLLKHGADPNIQAHSGHSAMHEACISHDGSLEILKALVKAGGNPNVSLLDNGITPLVVAHGSRFREGIQLLLDAGAEPNSTSIALHHAICAGSIRMTQSLLDIGADILFCNKDGLNALDIASSCNKPEIIQILRNIG